MSYSSAIRLPRRLERSLDSAALQILNRAHGRPVDFAAPPREQALLAPDSVSWRVFKNPLSVLIGGIAAVILELAEPAVRTGVWEHSSFRRDPLGRLQRTGMAAMVTVYGARSIALPMIERVERMHAGVKGTTPNGVPFSAADPQLLGWVHATAAFGFLEAYRRYAVSLSDTEVDAYYREGVSAARLYGAAEVPESELDMQALFDSMLEHLQPSPVIFEFLRILADTAIFPAPLRWMQRMFIRAAVELIPARIRFRLGLADFHGFHLLDKSLTGAAVAWADRIVLPASPSVQACLRLGLPPTYLYGRRC